MQRIEIIPPGAGPNAVARREASPLLTRFIAKIVVDVLPAAAASVIGGFLLTQYQFSHRPEPHLATEQVVPASAEMMKLVRDEHAMIVDYLKAQMAAERKRHAADDAANARAAAAADAERLAAAKAAADAADSQTAAIPAGAATATTVPTATAHGLDPALAAAKIALARTRTAPAMATPPHAPVVVAQTDTAAPAPTAAPVADGAAAEPKSLLARTIDIKEHVVHATLHAVSAIGGIPSWIAGFGDRFGGSNAGPNAEARQFATSS